MNHVLPLLLALLSAPALPQDEVVSQQPLGQDEIVSQETLEAWTAEILVEIEELREAKFPRPVSVSVADGKKFMEYMQERMDKSTTPERLAAEETTAKLLGLLPADMDYLATMNEFLESQVGGFYDPETEGFFLMEQFGGVLARTILAHELTHALDDQLYDIDGTLEEISESRQNSDAELAYQAVVEGSGTAIMNAWTMGKVRSKELSLADMSSAGDLGMEELSKAEPYMWKPLLGVYLRGAAFLNRTTSVMEGQIKTPSMKDIDVAFRTPPASSEQILHPEKYWDSDQRDDPVLVSFDTSSLPAGWDILHEDTLGEFLIGLLVEPLDDRGGMQGQMAMLGTKYTYPASEGWGGDRYVLLANGDARALLVETVWDSADDADEFQAEIGKLKPYLDTAVAGTATARGLEGGGFAVGRVGDRRVWLRSWIGVDADSVSGLVERAAVSVGE